MNFETVLKYTEMGESPQNALYMARNARHSSYQK